MKYAFYTHHSVVDNLKEGFTFKDIQNCINRWILIKDLIAIARWKPTSEELSEIDKNSFSIVEVLAAEALPKFPAPDDRVLLRRIVTGINSGHCQIIIER